MQRRAPLMMMSPKSPLSLPSSLTVLMLDWMLYALVVANPSQSAVSTVVMALAAGVLAFLFERRNDNRFGSAFGRAAMCAVAVAIPLPLYGSLLAASFGSWRCSELLRSR